MTRASLLASLTIITLATAQASDPQTEKLTAALSTDPSFKVRMQALRVLQKRIRLDPDPATDETIAAIGSAARTDENHMVRGLACFVLGKLRDPRGRDTLEAARADPEMFVQVQAEQALKSMPSRGGGRVVPDAELPQPALVEIRPQERRTPTARSTPRRASRRALPALVLSVEDTPGVDVPKATMSALSTAMRRRFKGLGAGRFEIGARGRKGHRIRGSIAKREIAPAPDGTRVTMIIRLTIATWPEGNLRHVLSARASAKTTSKRATAIRRLESKVLNAAVRSAVGDAMSTLGKS